MAYVVIALVSLAVSVLTLLSGFGLGTLLMPAFALFLPVTIAVAATAAVHFASNLFRITLLARRADWHIVAIFGIPAALAAALGAFLLAHLAHFAPLAAYRLGPFSAQVTTVKIVVGLLIAAFALFEILPRLRDVSVDRRYIPLGGLLSGFFGGLSGNQGALRAVFLLRAGLDKDRYIATAAVASVITDASRLIVYGATFFVERFWAAGSRDVRNLVLTGIAASLLGSTIGVRVMTKVTMRTVRAIVSALLLLTGALLVAGII